jgi:hypothetical protein
MVLDLIKLPFLVVPNLPPMASAVTSGVSIITGYLVSAAGFVGYIFSPALLIFILTGLVLIYNMDFLYRVVMWTLGKFPGINIH